MKTSLPNTKIVRGFTLVELLIVVAIIAILAAIGAAVFGNFQKSARDAARKSDIGAIADAMEVNYGGYGQTNYAGLATNFFSAGTYPIDPSTPGEVPGTTCDSASCYCDKTTAGTVGACTTSDTAIGSLKPASASGYLVCTTLETGGYFCQRNQRQ